MAATLQICVEAAKLKVERQQTGKVLAIPRASGGDDGKFATAFANPSLQQRNISGAPRTRTGWTRLGSARTAAVWRGACRNFVGLRGSRAPSDYERAEVGSRDR